MLWAYILTGIVGIPIIITIQGIFAYSIASILFRSDSKNYLIETTQSESDMQNMHTDHLAMRYEVSRRWQYWVFLLSLSFIMAGAIEECLKYYAVMLARRYGLVKLERDYIVIAIASALGFATLENVGFILAACEDNSQDLKKLALTVFERVAFGSPLHSMGAILIGINAILRDVRYQPKALRQVLRESIMFHGLFDFALMSISAFNGNIGWIHPREGYPLYLTLGMAVVFFLTLASRVKRRLQQNHIVF